MIEKVELFLTRIMGISGGGAMAGFFLWLCVAIILKLAEKSKEDSRLRRFVLLMEIPPMLTKKEMKKIFKVLGCLFLISIFSNLCLIILEFLSNKL